MLKLDHFLPYRLSVASNAVSKRISQSYRKRFGLKIPEWRLIAILAERDSMTPAEIGQAGELDKITVSRHGPRSQQGSDQRPAAWCPWRRQPPGHVRTSLAATASWAWSQG